MYITFVSTDLSFARNWRQILQNSDLPIIFRRFESSMTTLCTIISELKRWRFPSQKYHNQYFQKNKAKQSQTACIIFQLGDFKLTQLVPYTKV